MPDQWDADVYRQRAEAWRQRAAQLSDADDARATCLSLADDYEKVTNLIEQRASLATFGLHGVIDTGSGSNRLKRPDIALYVDRDEADVGSPAAVVIESKKPVEVTGFPSLRDALVDDIPLHDKFVPYVVAHAERVTFSF